MRSRDNRNDPDAFFNLGISYPKASDDVHRPYLLPLPAGNLNHVTASQGGCLGVGKNGGYRNPVELPA